jgi:hypothetical protein
MLPSNLISYIYSESGIARLVSYGIKSEGVNSLRVTVQQPPHLDELSGGGVGEGFAKRIGAEGLFLNLKKNYDLDDKDYISTLNPIRYRHIINRTILKQYLRENMIIGEVEVEDTSATKKHLTSKHLAMQMGGSESPQTPYQMKGYSGTLGQF